MNKVDLRCIDDYVLQDLEAIFKDSFNKLDLGSVLTPEKRVLIKVCMPVKAMPALAETTHPNLVLALVNCLAEYGVKCIVADSPYGSYKKEYWQDVYTQTGMLPTLNDAGCELYTGLKTIEVEAEQGIKAKSFKMLDIVNDVDYIINVGKLKLDARLGYLGVTSNLLGVLPGETKTIMLNRLATQKDWHNLNLDLYDVVKEKIILNILDGVVALQSNKIPHLLSLLAIGKDSLSVDAAVLDVIKQDLSNTIIQVAEDRQFISSNSLYQLIGNDVESFNIEDFTETELDINAPININNLKTRKYYKKHQQRPVIIPAKCKGCAVCSKLCPTGAIVMKYDKNGELFADIDYKKCICCNKCVMGCPYKKVDLKTPSGYKKLDKKFTKYNQQ